jgi:hypothetical protein
MLLLFTLWLVNGLHKTAPLWIYPIRQQIVAIVYMAIHLKGHATSVTAQQISYQRGAVKYVDVVFASRQAEKNMPDPQGLVSYGLQNNTTDTILVLELPLPCHGVVFPGPVHSVQAPKHPWKTTSGIDVQLLLEISTAWHSQKTRLKTSTNGNSRSLHSLNGCALTGLAILISGVRRDPIS